MIDMKTLRLVGFIVAFAIAPMVQANVPEPNITLYGKVFNRYQGAELEVTQGTLKWTVRANDDLSDSRTYTAHLAPIADSEFTYRLDIPQQVAVDLALLPAVSVDAVKSEEGVIDSSVAPAQYDHVSITIDGVDARILEPADGSLIIGQDNRSQHLQVNLQISRPPVDTDEDGMPDSWELQYFGDMHAADPNEDSDGDGLTNLEEYQLASDPTPGLGDNRVPTLLDASILLYEQGTTQFNPLIVDSDTPPGGLDVTFTTIPGDVELIYAASGDKGYPQGHVLAGGESVTLRDMHNGNILLVHKPASIDPQQEVQPPAAMTITLNDGDNSPVSATIQFDLYHPSNKKDGGAQLWFDSTVDTLTFDAYDFVQENYDYYLPDYAGVKWMYVGRAGNGGLDLLHHIDETGWEWLSLPLGMSGPLGQQTIDMDGTSYIESWAQEEYDVPPFELSDGAALFSVFKSSGDGSQILIHDMSAELAITGTNDASYPNRLRFSRQGHENLYAALPTGQDWGVSGLYIDAHDTSMEWNTKIAAFDDDDESVTTTQSVDNGITWGTSRTLGGKMIGSAMSSDYHLSEPFEGSFGEMLLLNCGQCEDVKWHVYAYLYSKWFGYVVVDHSNATRAKLTQSLSATLSAIPDEYVGVYDSVDEMLWNEGDWAYELLPERYEVFKENYGKDRNYFLFGGAAQDRLVGGWEDDVLVGGAGEDWLTGLGGADLFIPKDGNTVMDFEPQQGDRLYIAHLLQVEDESKPLSAYLKLTQDFYYTYIHIDANADGSGFDDATIWLANVSYMDRDITRLWATGAIQAGKVRPTITLQLEQIVPTTGLTEHDEPLELLIKSIGGPLPVGLYLPMSVSGTAVKDEDYRLEVESYNKVTQQYEFQALTSNAVPINAKAGDTQLRLRIVPLEDARGEVDETIELGLMPLEFYQVSQINSVMVGLSDGPSIVTLSVTDADATEDAGDNGQFVISRTGSLDAELRVSIEMVGSATNGDDYSYVAQTAIFSPGKSRVAIDIVPYRDVSIEQVEFAELALLEGDGYRIEGSVSARVAILDNSKQDSDGDGLPDSWEAKYGLSLFVNDASLDNDGDGLTNSEEYALGLNAASRDSDGDGVDDLVDADPHDANNTQEKDIPRIHSVTTPIEQALVINGEKLLFKVISSTSDDNENLSGITLRLHYNSNNLIWGGFSELDPNDLVARDTQPTADTYDYDNDPDTDVYVMAKWDSISNSWSGGSGETLLYIAGFNVSSSFTSGSTHVRFSAENLHYGYEFNGRDVTLTPLGDVQVDIDGDGLSTSSVEGLATMRYAMGLRGNSLKDGISTTDIDATVSPLLPNLDLDANGAVEPLTDLMLFARCLEGYSGTQLTDGVLAHNALRTDPNAILNYCQALQP